MIRRVCIFLVALGAALLFLRQNTSLPTLPVPPAGRLVKGIASIGSAGDYYVVVTMPRIDDSLGLSEETVPCTFTVTITDSADATQRKEITSLVRYGQFGFGRTQYYRGGDAFHLRRGEYDLEVSSRLTCAVAAERGATISLEQNVGNPTDYYLRSLLGSWLATGALVLGLIGLVACEFKKQPNQSATDQRP